MTRTAEIPVRGPLSDIPRKAGRVEPQSEPQLPGAKFLHGEIAHSLLARLKVSEPRHRRIAPCFALHDLSRRGPRHALKVFAESPGTLDHGVVSVGGAAGVSDVALCRAGESKTRGPLTSFDCPHGQTYNRPLTPSTDATSHLSSVTDSVTRERGFPHADAIRHR